MSPRRSVVVALGACVALGTWGSAAMVGCGGDSGTFVAAIDAGDGDATVDATIDVAGGDAGGGDAIGANGDAYPDGALVAEGGSPGDAGPGGNANTLPCGNAACAIPGQACCVFQNATPPPDFSYACYNGGCPSPSADAGADAQGGGGGGGVTALSCSGAANCPPNTVCCVTEIPPIVRSDCRAACGPSQAQLCDPRAAISGCAPDAGACSSANVTDWGLPNTYATCGGVGN